MGFAWEVGSLVSSIKTRYEMKEKSLDAILAVAIVLVITLLFMYEFNLFME